MGFRRSFAVGLAVRAVLLAAAILLAVLAFSSGGLAAARIVALGLVAIAAIMLWRHIDRTNVDLARFVEALSHGDLSASFGGGRQGSGFGVLGEALNRAIRRLRQERATAAEDGRFYAGLVEDAPTALLTVDADGRVETANKAARRLFARHSGVRVEDFAVYGPSLVEALDVSPPGTRRLVSLATDLGPQQAMLRVAALDRLGRAMRVVAVQPIQDALNAVELAAQSDLIRVLTHEIMNSMTPITSLARSAAALMRAADDGSRDDVADARCAVDTLARRTDGVIHFVETYRQISRSPRIERRRFPAAAFADELRRLFEADAEAARAHLSVRVEPADLALDGDPDLLAQVVINLLRNAAEAAPGPVRIDLDLIGGPGASARICVSDDGPGIPADKRADIFLPFYTTKAKGTGVGLSLARQVMLAHDGAILIDDAPAGGARFTLLLG